MNVHSRRTEKPYSLGYVAPEDRQRDKVTSRWLYANSRSRKRPNKAARLRARQDKINRKGNL